jgi:hypothetical protein
MLPINFFLVYQLKGVFSTGVKPFSAKFKSQDLQFPTTPKVTRTRSPASLWRFHERQVPNYSLRVEVIVVPLNVVVCPDGLTKDTPAGDWVNTIGNPTLN